MFGGRDRGGRDRGGRSRRGSSGTTGLSRFTSAPDGRVVLDISKATPELYDAEKLDVHALLPGNSRVSESVAMPQQGDVNVTLRIPLTCTLDLKLMDSKGALSKEPITVTWYVEFNRDSWRGGERGEVGLRGAGGLPAEEG